VLEGSLQETKEASSNQHRNGKPSIRIEVSRLIVKDKMDSMHIFPSAPQTMGQAPAPPPNDGEFPMPMSRSPTGGQMTNGDDDSTHHNHHLASAATDQEENHHPEASIGGDGSVHPATTTEENPIDAEELMKHVNDQLEASMADYKTKVKHIFKELVAFQQEFQAIQQIWIPIQEAEHKEAARLEDLQADLNQTMSEMSWLAAAMEEETTT
jgi:hypothetical protein